VAWHVLSQASGPGSHVFRGGLIKRCAAVIQEPWICEDCEQENEADDDVCCACELPRPVVLDPRYTGYKIGIVVSAEEVNGKKLMKLGVDVGADEPLKIVTNDTKVKEGYRVVVATIGATVGEIVVSKANVGGVPSEGMLCDCPCLGWKGGAAGIAARVPDSFEVGTAPPSTRPRMDQ
jgi:tRNA-binding EMAP/Myf-like protein